MLSGYEVRALIRSAEHPFYVYMLLDDRGLPFYVGKGTGERCFAHEGEAQHPEFDTDKHREIRRLRDVSIGLRYQIAAFFPTDDGALDEERRLIELYGRRHHRTGILTNRSDGGEGHSREYPPEPWARDENGIPIGVEIRYPAADQLMPPRFAREHQPQMTWVPEKADWAASEEDQAIFAAEREHPSGPEMPTIGFWQHAGWTVQVFWHSLAEFDPIEVDRAGRAECVLFRFFDFERLLIEDSIRVTAHTIVTPSRLIARILWALASEDTPTAGRQTGKSNLRALLAG
jgi:hypothetical protein